MLNSTPSPNPTPPTSAHRAIAEGGLPRPSTATYYNFPSTTTIPSTITPSTIQTLSRSNALMMLQRVTLCHQCRCRCRPQPSALVALVTP